MKERPILFSGPMVRAILQGRKTMTRRVMNPQPQIESDARYICGWKYFIYRGAEYSLADIQRLSPYGLPGDRLWVRETFCSFVKNGKNGVAYRADTEDGYFSPCETLEGGYPESCLSHPGCEGCTAERWKPTWRSSIFMPRSSSRITLEITTVRVERLQAITAEDALAEGVSWNGEREHPRDNFIMLWDSINVKRPGYSWNANPWVWVVEFKRAQ